MIWRMNSIPGYAIDRYVTDTGDLFDEPSVVCKCDRCRSEIVEGEDYYALYDENVCLNCAGEDEDLEEYRTEAEFEEYEPEYDPYDD